MASESPASIRSADSTQDVIADNAAPPCNTCNTTLTVLQDTQKNNTRFFKNCKSCRDKETAQRRKKRSSYSFQSFSLHTSKKRKVVYPRKEPSPTPPPSDRECIVCADSFPVQDFPSLSACAHEPDVCQTCFLQWLSMQLDSTTWEFITCPASNCGSQITHDDVKMYAPADVFARFDELSMRAFLSKDASFRYCLAKGCSSGQVHDSGAEGQIFRCGACGFRVCTVHDMAFHDGETCAAYDERLVREEKERVEREVQEDQSRKERVEQEAKSLAEVQKAVMCPNQKCKVPIHKLSGCDHMTCRLCRFEFCYVCRAPYKGPEGIGRRGNDVHTVQCRYHSTRLPELLLDESEDEDVMGADEDY